MKNKKLLLFLIIFSAIFIAITINYFNKVNYFKPLSISISGLSDAEIGNVNVRAETPFGKKIYLQKNIPQKSFSTNGSWIFIKNIFLLLPAKADSNTYSIEIKHGNDEINFSSEVIDNYLEETGSKINISFKEYRLKYQFPGNILEKIHSVFFWQNEIKTEIFTLVMVFLILIIVSIWLFNNFSKLRDIVYKWLSIKGKSQKLFILFLAINILLLIYFISLIQEKRFNINTCFIFYILILNTLLILAFAAGKIFKKQELFFNLRITFVVVMVMFCIIELILRGLHINATYFEKTYGKTNTGVYTNNTNFRRVLTFTPNSELRHTYQEFKYYRKTFNEGFTQPLPSQLKKKNEVRILALGDSFTEGVGSSFDSTWAELLKNKLNKSDNKRCFDIFNAGVSGSDPVLQYVLLTEVLQSYMPDLVVDVIDESDINDFIVRGGMERIAKKDTITGKKGPWWEWAFNISFMVRLIAINGFNYNQLLLNKQEMQTETTIAIEKIKITLQSFRDYTQRNKMQFLTVFVPSPYELAYEDRYKFKSLIDSLNKDDIHTLDMFWMFGDEINNNPKLLYTYYWKIDGHCTPEGYNFIAETIYKYINDNSVLNE